jgi:MFS family permease
MVGTDQGPTPGMDAHFASSARSASSSARGLQRPRSGFWTVAYAFLIVMAFATLPSPLYGLYRVRDDLSAFAITVIYAIFAGGTIITLGRVPAIAGRVGRRGVMLAAVATMMVAAGLLAGWKDLPGLLIGRLLTGVAVGLAAGTAITYLIELQLRANPTASVVRARTIGTSVNVGALGIGPLVAGCLAQWASWPMTLAYLVFIALGAFAVLGLATVRETGPPGHAAPSAGRRARPRRPRLPVPAAAATLTAFSAMGLFAGLSGLFLATTLGHPSPALSGATLFLVFSCGVGSHLATTNLPASRVLTVGTTSMLVGLVLLVTSVRLSSPSLALFLISGAAHIRCTSAKHKAWSRDPSMRTTRSHRPPVQSVGLESSATGLPNSHHAMDSGHPAANRIPGMSVDGIRHVDWTGRARRTGSAVLGQRRRSEE